MPLQEYHYGIDDHGVVQRQFCRVGVLRGKDSHHEVGNRAGADEPNDEDAEVAYKRHLLYSTELGRYRRRSRKQRRNTAEARENDERKQHCDGEHEDSL